MIYVIIAILVGSEIALANELKYIYKNIKCLVCEGQSVADSESIFAQNIRNFVAKKFQQGYSRKDIELELIDKYGAEVLYDPPLDMNTILLWLLPVIFFVGGILILLYKFKNERFI